MKDKPSNEMGTRHRLIGELHLSVTELIQEQPQQSVRSQLLSSVGIPAIENLLFPDTTVKIPEEEMEERNRLKTELLNIARRRPANKTLLRAYESEEVERLQKGNLVPNEVEAREMVRLAPIVERIAQEREMWPDTESLRNMGLKGKLLKRAIDQTLRMAATVDEETMRKLLGNNKKAKPSLLYPTGRTKRSMPEAQHNALINFRKQLATLGKRTKEQHLNANEWKYMFKYMSEVTTAGVNNPYRLKHSPLNADEARKLFNLSATVIDRWKTIAGRAAYITILGILASGVFGKMAYSSIVDYAMSGRTTSRVLTVDPRLAGRTSIPTEPPEPTKTPNPETSRFVSWNELRKQYNLQVGISGRVIESGDVQNPQEFFPKLTDFIKSNNMLGPDGILQYDAGKDSEIYMATEYENGAIRVWYDGPHTSPPFAAKTLYYSQSDGICSARADQPFDNGTWQQNEIKFDPENPKACYFASGTSSGMIVIIMIEPTSAQPNVFATIVNSYAAPMPTLTKP